MTLPIQEALKRYRTQTCVLLDQENLSLNIQRAFPSFVVEISARTEGGQIELILGKATCRDLARLFDTLAETLEEQPEALTSWTSEDLKSNDQPKET